MPNFGVDAYAANPAAQVTPRHVEKSGGSNGFASDQKQRHLVRRNPNQQGLFLTTCHDNAILKKNSEVVHYADHDSR